MSDTTNISTGLRNIMKSKKLTITQLADLSNIPEDTIKSIRSGKTKNPGIQTIIHLANAMQCSVDELIGHIPTNSEEAELISSWRKLDGHGRRLIQAITNIELSDNPKFSESSSKRAISCIIFSSKLEDGFTYDNFYIETIEIPFNCFQDADFCVHINTDTLSPIYFNGDILAIEKRCPHNGEAAIFIHKSIGYIRKYEINHNKEQLRPLLPYYKPLDIQDFSNYTCFGTILGIVKSSSVEATRQS